MGAPIIKCLRKNSQAFFGMCEHTKDVSSLVFRPCIVTSIRVTHFIFRYQYQTDCHMMVAKPEQWVNDIADTRAEQFTFHYESTGRDR